MCDRIIVVLEGVLVDESTGTVVVKKGQSIGDEYIISSMRNKKMDKKIALGSDSVLAIIEYYKIFQLLGGDFESVIKKNQVSQNKKLQILAERTIQDVQVEDLIFIKKLG
jgi:cGMP-dependent protein kinase